MGYAFLKSFEKCLSSKSCYFKGAVSTRRPWALSRHTPNP